MLDGFMECNNILSDGMEHNIQYARNEASPFSDIDKLQGASDGRILVDTYYGLTYDSWVEKEPVSPYGRTAEFPEFAGDQLANLGFLRVPFRRVPRRLVKNRTELEQIINSVYSKDPSVTVAQPGLKLSLAARNSNS